MKLYCKPAPFWKHVKVSQNALYPPYCFPAWARFGRLIPRRKTNSEYFQANVVELSKKVNFQHIPSIQYLINQPLNAIWPPRSAAIRRGRTSENARSVVSSCVVLFHLILNMREIYKYTTSINILEYVILFYELSVY